MNESSEVNYEAGKKLIAEVKKERDQRMKDYISSRTKILNKVLSTKLKTKKLKKQPIPTVSIRQQEIADFTTDKKRFFKEEYTEDKRRLFFS